jgi:NAD(P)-dependent dehydrogenase (short-subunit alcohol dehydrogenase family)
VSYVEELFGLNDVRAIVTGGAGVLAKTMARTLARCGAAVSIWGRGASHPVDEAVHELTAELGSEAVIAGETVDTGDEDAVKRALAATESAIGVPNVLVNGVGGSSRRAPFVETDTDDFEQVLHLNLIAGLVIPTKIVASRWLELGIRGSVINIASMGSYLPLSGGAAYSAAKAAVLNLTYANAKEFAPSGIRVNAIAPGFFVGHQNRALLIRDNDTGELTERGQSIIDHTPFGRFGEPQDLAGTTAFLASDVASGFLTGVCIPVDGGYLIDNI